MDDRLSPLVSEFETEEQAVSYESWFRAKVLRSLESPGAGVPHYEVMARVDAIIEEARSEQK